MFAPVFHPAARHAAPVRGELRVPTVFNFLGPLTNPARPFAQVVGVSDPRMLPLMAEVLARRGVRAKLFRGEDGLDELTTNGLSTVLDVRDGEVREGHLDPQELGLARASADDLRGGDAAESAAIARAILAGETGPAPRRRAAERRRRPRGRRRRRLDRRGDGARPPARSTGARPQASSSAGPRAARTGSIPAR